MSDPRPHLSIGEVLSLLQDEFPDITISKIRFLESQGLLNPERTPSGYRKFYDHDVEQLRWVLRQQKDNFLPLKVIKDRLAAGQLDGPASESGVLDLAPVAADETPAPQRTAAVAGAGAGTAQASPPAPAPVAAPETDGHRTSPSPATDVAGDGPRPAATPATTPEPTPSPTPAAVPAPGPAPGPAPAPVKSRARSDREVASSVSLSAEELCAATGVSARLLDELERFGLVDGRSLGNDTVYDDDAMVVCRLAVTMADAGLEARHLRMFKVSAEREAGLYEQLALPRLRSGRTEARQEAVAQVTALSGAAAELHAALLRRALRSSLGPL